MADLDNRVAVQLVNLLYSQLNIGLYGTLLCGLVVTALFWNHTPLNLLFAWLGMLTAIMATRYLIVTRFHRSDLSRQNISFWSDLFLLGTL